MSVNFETNLLLMLETFVLEFNALGLYASVWDAVSVRVSKTQSMYASPDYVQRSITKAARYATFFSTCVVTNDCTVKDVITPFVLKNDIVAKIALLDQFGRRPPSPALGNKKVCAGKPSTTEITVAHLAAFRTACDMKQTTSVWDLMRKHHTYEVSHLSDQQLSAVIDSAANAANFIPDSQDPIIRYVIDHNIGILFSCLHYPSAIYQQREGLVAFPPPVAINPV